MLQITFLLMLGVSMVRAAVIHVPGDQESLENAVSISAIGDTISLAEQEHVIDTPIHVPRSITLLAASVLSGESSWSQGCSVSGVHDIVFTPDDSLVTRIRGINFYNRGIKFPNREARVEIQHCRFEFSFDVDFVNLYSLEVNECYFSENSIRIHYCNDVRFSNVQFVNLRERLSILYSYADFFDVLHIQTQQPSVFVDAIHLDASEVLLQNCTIAGFEIEGTHYTSSLVRVSNASHLTIHNSILFNNIYNYYAVPIRLVSEDAFVRNTLTIDYSCIEQGADGVEVDNISSDLYWRNGNISDSPSFGEDYSLLSSSPCIDAGDPSSPLDPDGTIADMGALFYCQGDQVSIPEEAVVVTEPGYTAQLAVEFKSACAGVSVDSASTTLMEFILGTFTDSIGAGFQSGFFNLTFDPQSQGLFQDTLHIWADTEISNTEDPRHHVVPLVGESGPIPAAVTDLTVAIEEDQSAMLNWSPVDSTIYGNPVTPDIYLVFYNELDPYVEDYWFYLFAVPGTEFEHFRAAQFSDLINYRVEAWVDIAGRVEDLEPGMSFSGVNAILRGRAVAGGVDPR